MKSVLAILSILIVASIGLSATDLFSGKWKGEISAGSCGGFGAPGGGGGFPGGGGGGRGGPGFDFASEASQRGGGFPGGPGGDFPGGPGGNRRGPQKVTLNIKTKEDKKTAAIKLTGNITIGDTTEDVRDGKIAGSKISFTTGKPPNSVCQYAGELDAETKELRMTRTIIGNAAPGIPLTLKR
jgi:hypothetical protein